MTETVTETDASEEAAGRFDGLSSGQIAARIDDELAQHLGQNFDDVLKLIDLAKTPETVKQAYCPHCEKRVDVRYPDYKGAQALLEFVFNRVMGRPGQRADKDPGVSVAAELADMTDAELEAISEG